MTDDYVAGSQLYFITGPNTGWHLGDWVETHPGIGTSEAGTLVTLYEDGKATRANGRLTTVEGGVIFELAAIH